MILLLMLLTILITFTYKKTNMKGDFSLDKIITGQIKGLAIIMVILSHLNSTYLEWDFFRPFGAIGVAIFLFSSGYGLTKSYSKNGLIHFFKKRILTVMIPYILVTILWIVINSILGVNHSLYTNLLSIFALDFNFTIDGTMWYIPYIMIWYLVFYLAFQLFNKNSLRGIILFGLSLLLIAGWKFGYTGPSRYHFGIHAFSFPLGFYYAVYGEDIIKRFRNQSLLMINSISLIIIGVNILFFFETPIYYMINSVFGMFIIISVFLFLHNKNIKCIFLEFIGGYSYELYLLEGYLIGLIIMPNLINKQFYLWIYIIILSIATFVLNTIISFINSKIYETKELKNSIEL